MKTLTARNPSEARGIRKALNAAGIKFEFTSTRGGKKKKKRKSNPKRRPRKKKSLQRRKRR